MKKIKEILSLTLFLWLSFALPLWPKKWQQPQPVYAANGYIDPNGDGTTNNWSANPSGTFYTTVDEATRQPSSPNTGDYISGAVNNAGTIFFRMGTISSVQTVSSITVWVHHNDGNNGQLAVQLYDDNETTTRTTSSNITQRTSNSWDSVTFSSLSLTQAQLDTLSIAITSSKNGGGAPANATVHEVYADVTYTPQVAVSISLSTDGSVSFGHQAVDTTQNTTTSGLNDVETISVDTGPANLDIRSSTFSDGGNTWNLSTGNGSDQVLWEFSNNDGSNWTIFSAADTNFTFDTSVSQGQTRNLTLRLTTPTTTSSYSQHSSTVTILASSP